jgi:Family of unknown function (DUF6282)
VPRVDLAGVSDLHVHSAPCLFDRIADDIEMAEMLASAGYAAVVLKSHHESTVGRAEVAAKRVPGVQVHGGIVLNHFVGGINPTAVEAALVQGGKVVWMPTMHARCHADFYGTTTGYGFIQGTTLRARDEPIAILDEEGRLRERVLEVAKLVAEHDAILATAHLSKQEARALIYAAPDVGLRKLVITHPHFKFLGYTDAELAELAARGATLELCSGTVQTLPGYTTVETVARTIRRVGAEHCIVSSDTGSPRKPCPPETTRAYLYSLGVLGISDAELRGMSVESPQRLLEFRR